VLLHKRSPSNLVARLGVPRQWRHRAVLSKWQYLTGHRQVNHMDRLSVRLTARLQGKA
jgi:hypothetical protein